MSGRQVYYYPARAGLQAASAIDSNPSVVRRVPVGLRIQSVTVIQSVL